MAAVAKGLFSATFFVSSLEMAAAMKVIEIIQRDGVIERLWAVGERFQRELREIVAGSPLSLRVTGLPPMPFLAFEMEDEAANAEAKTAFYAEAVDRGVYFHPNHHWFVNFAHSDEDVTRTMEVCSEALKAAERAVG
jgi:glutamate-1-semialdehyde aminotransferase